MQTPSYLEAGKQTVHLFSPVSGKEPLSAAAPPPHTHQMPLQFRANMTTSTDCNKPPPPQLGTWLSENLRTPDEMNFWQRKIYIGNISWSPTKRENWNHVSIRFRHWKEVHNKHKETGHVISPPPFPGPLLLGIRRGTPNWMFAVESAKQKQLTRKFLQMEGRRIIFSRQEKQFTRAGMETPGGGSSPVPHKHSNVLLLYKWIFPPGNDSESLTVEITFSNP